MPDGNMRELHTSQAAGREQGRGRQADKPSEIPKRGWRDIAWRVKDELAEDGLSMLAAGVAYYGFLALFPSLVTIVAIFGLVADPGDISRQLVSVGGLLPGEAQVILEEQMKKLTSQPEEHLTFSAVVALVLAIWSSSSGMKALMQLLNVAYDETEKRSFFWFNLTALGLTLGAVAMLVAALVAIVGVPILLELIGLDQATEWLIAIARWPLLGVMVMFGLAVLYRYGPSRDEPQWKWVSWGAAVTTVLWLGGCVLFSVYVSNFGSFDETYGSLGAVVILLLWLNLTAYLIGFGAEINAEMEHQTRRDTTKGPERPIGTRGAAMADSVGRVP